MCFSLHTLSFYLSEVHTDADLTIWQTITAPTHHSVVSSTLDTAPRCSMDPAAPPSLLQGCKESTVLGWRVQMSWRHPSVRFNTFLQSCRAFKQIWMCDCVVLLLVCHCADTWESNPSDSMAGHRRRRLLMASIFSSNVQAPCSRVPVSWPQTSRGRHLSSNRGFLFWPQGWLPSRCSEGAILHDTNIGPGIDHEFNRCIFAGDGHKSDCSYIHSGYQSMFGRNEHACHLGQL